MQFSNEPYDYRQDPRVPNFDDSGPIAVMDASCGLCAKGARWIAHNDRKRVFRIVPIQSDLGGALARHYGVDPADPSTWLVIDAGKGFGSFGAVMRAAQHFGGPWRGLALLRMVPGPLLNWVYARIARNRYRVFGRTDLCAMPDPEVQARLLQ